MRISKSIRGSKPRLRPLALATAGLLGVTAISSATLAQIAAEVEGPIDAGSIGIGTEINGAEMSVMGIDVIIPATATIHSPSNEDLRDASGAPIGLLDLSPLPNRSGHAGFEGGTAIVIGTSSGGVITAEDVFVEPAETSRSASSPCAQDSRRAGVASMRRRQRERRFRTPAI